MYPAPPVTRTLSFISALQAEEALQRLEQAVPPPGLRGLFEGDGRLVQELVEQRMAEVLDFSAVVRAQMREAAQRALQLGGAHLVQPLAELLQDGHDDQPAVPGPKALDFLAHDALRRRNVAAPLGRRLCRHRLEIVDVVQEDVLELGDRGLHIARHAEIEDTQRTPAAASDGRRDAVPGDDGVRRRGRAEHDVGIGEVLPRLVQREGACPQLFGDRPRALVGAVGHERHPHALGHGAGPLGEVEFRAIARGEQHAAARTRRQHARERRRHFPGLVREALAHLERRRAVTHAQNGDAHRLLTQRNRWVPGAASLSATYTSSTAVKLAMLANAARRPAQWRTTRTPTAHPKTTQVSIPHTTWAASTDAPPAYCTPNPSSTPNVTVGNPSTSDRWFNWSSRSSGGNNRNTGPKRFALSSWNCSRYRAAAMNASASMARPKTLTVMWRIDQAPRPDAGAPSGASPISNARPRSPVASGPVNTPTADARNRPSLAACSATRNRASMESVGATPTKGVSCATPITCAASPSSGTPSPSARDAGRSPANGANASAVANAYRPSAIRCGTRTTGRKAPAPLSAVAGRRSGRHLPDEPHRHAGNEVGVADI